MKKLLAIIFTACILVSCICIPGNHVIFAATEIQKAQDKKAALEKQLGESQSKLANYKKELESSGSEQERLAAAEKIEQAEKEVLTGQLLQLYAEGEAIEAAFKDAENAYLQKQEEFYEKSRIMYVYSRKSPLEILADAENLSDFFKRIKLVLYVAEEDNKIIDELEDAKQEFEYKKQYQEECAGLVEEQIEAKELTINNINLSKSDLQSKIDKAKKILAEIEKQGADITEDINAVNSEIKKLKDKERIEAEKAAKAAADAKKAAEEAKKNSSNNGNSGNNVNGGSNNNNNSNSNSSYSGGSMRWPVPSSSRITSPYGTRQDPFTGAYVTHTGIDIGAPRGSAILAAADGTVIMSAVNGGFGKCVKINHGNGIITLYGHCDELLVTTGQKVKKGDLIARVGSTGRSTGNHLHFEVQKNGSHVNPMPYLQG